MRVNVVRKTVSPIFFLRSTLVTLEAEKIFLHFLTELKIHHFSCSAHEAFNIVDPSSINTKSSNKIYLWLEGSLVSQPNVCGGFSGKTSHFLSLLKKHTKLMFLPSALVENLNANNEKPKESKLKKRQSDDFF